MNVLTFSGNLGGDCRQNTQGSTPVVNFGVALKSGYGEKQQTIWVDCSLWGSRGLSLAQYLIKGAQVIVSGEFGMREYNGKQYATCRVDKITLVGGNKQQGAQTEQAAPPDASFDNNDDIPF